VRSRPATDGAQTWSIGPLALSLPLFDAGRRAAAETPPGALRGSGAAVRGARAAGRARGGGGAGQPGQRRERSEDARIAGGGYRASFAATEARYRSGLGSLIELEDQRRVLLVAENALVRCSANGWPPGSRCTARRRRLERPETPCARA
jgi:hypothetical protein